VILQQVDDVNMYVNTVLVAEDDVLLLEDEVETDVEVLVSAAVIGGAVSITIEYSTVPVLNELVLLHVDGDYMLDSTRVQILGGKVADVTMHPVVIAGVNDNKIELNSVTNDEVLPLHACVDVVGVTVLVIREVGDEINTPVDDTLVAEDDGLLINFVAHTDVEVLVSPTVLWSNNASTVECPTVPVLTVTSFLDVDGDNMLDSPRVQTLVDTGVNTTFNPVVSNEDDASTLVLTVLADDDMLLFNNWVDEVQVGLVVILQVVDNVNTSVVTEGVAEGDGPLLKDGADTDEQVLVYPVALMHAASVTVQSSRVLVLTTLAVQDVDRDYVPNPARVEVMVRISIDSAMKSVVLEDADANTLVLTACQ